jgi:hypothetical protein
MGYVRTVSKKKYPVRELRDEAIFIHHLHTQGSRRSKRSPPFSSEMESGDKIVKVFGVLCTNMDHLDHLATVKRVRMFRSSSIMGVVRMICRVAYVNTIHLDIQVV